MYCAECDSFKAQFSNGVLITVGEGPYSEKTINSLINLRYKVVENNPGKKWVQIFHAKGSAQFYRGAQKLLDDNDIVMFEKHNLGGIIIFLEGKLLQEFIMKLAFKAAGKFRHNIYFVHSMDEAIKTANYILE